MSSVLEAAAAYLRDRVLEPLPGPTLRLALDLGLTSLLRHIEREFLDVRCCSRCTSCHRLRLAAVRLLADVHAS